MEGRASGAMHVDPGIKDCKDTRAGVETLIAMTAALLCIVPCYPAVPDRIPDNRMVRLQPNT